MNISALNFEVLEISTKEENGQSTGVVVNFPNSIVFSKPVKNINKGFKYVWNELVIKVKLDCDLVSNKQEIYKIVNNIETIKSIPRKMKSEISNTNMDNRVYFNKYDPIIYTKIVDGHVELTVRYLMHPKKSRYVESTIWNKIYLAYTEGKIDLYTSED
jgi:small-conductance mechanosensitive channel